MSQFEVGDWVRLSPSCDGHPSKRAKEIPPREFIGIYLSDQHVSWLSGELPEHDFHWNKACLKLFQRAPKAGAV